MLADQACDVGRPVPRAAEPLEVVVRRPTGEGAALSDVDGAAALAQLRHELGARPLHRLERRRLRATGGNLILGNPNSATSQTGLTSNNAGKALNITQQSTGAGATALGLNVPAGKPPFAVNSGTKVANLNADKLDALNSTDFQRRCKAGAVAAYAYIDDSALPVGDFGYHEVTAPHFSCAEPAR